MVCSSRRFIYKIFFDWVLKGEFRKHVEVAEKLANTHTQEVLQHVLYCQTDSVLGLSAGRDPHTPYIYVGLIVRAYRRLLRGGELAVSFFFSC